MLVVALYEFGSSIRNFCGRGEVLLGKLMMQFNKEKGKFRNLRVGFVVLLVYDLYLLLF